MQTLLSLSVALLAGLLLSRAAKLVKLPAVTAYLVAGILVGPYLLGQVYLPHADLHLGFTAEDVEVLPGAEIDAVVINVALQPVDSVEKIYMTVTVSVNVNA